MKEQYSSPTIVGSNATEGDGLIPLAAVTITGAAALLAGYAAGRAVTKVMEARPSIRLPYINTDRRDDNDLCLA